MPQALKRKRNGAKPGPSVSEGFAQKHKEKLMTRIPYRKSHNTQSFSNVTFTDSEPYALCFYLYNLFKETHNKKIIEDFKEAVQLFLECVNLLNKNERLFKVMENEILNLEKKNLLTPIEAQAGEFSSFDDFGIPYKYVQDKQIERNMRRYDSCECNDKNLVNLHRILTVSEKPVFSAIINTVVFKDCENLKLDGTLKISKKMEKEVFDFSRTKFLMDQVGLSENEARYILLECRLDTIENLHDIVRNYSTRNTKNIKCIPQMLNLSENELHALLRSDQKIKAYGFIDEDGDYNDSLNDCIAEQSIEPYFNDLLKPVDCSDSYGLESFSVKDEHKEICLDLLNGKKPVSILFYGKPGSGKTELAKSICKMTGKKIYIFKNETESDSRSNMLGKLVCLLSMERTDSVIIVDEADSILKTVEMGFFGVYPTKTKGTVNKMLEENKDKVIYIINHESQIDESTRRRFTFSIKFDSMPLAMLRSIAQSKLEKMKIAEESRSEILMMLDKYHLTGASVDNLVKALEGMDLQDEKAMLKKADILLKENSLLLNGKAKMRESVKSEYDPKVLNASMNPLKIVEMVQNASRFAEKNKGAESGIRMLFYGLSGTGKTELARYISEQLGKPILLKRASDILGCYVGQNEKNVRDAFAEAENTGAVLLFDEADSFIYDRNNAGRSWERTLVNEFLTQMEEFSGILICTTNLRNIVDPAMQRRFHMLLEFKPMKFDGIKIMAERYFPSWHLSNSQLEELEDMKSVTPGDFGALAGKIRFMNPDEIDSDFILDELKKLQEEKKKQWKAESGESERKIGFSA